MSITVPFQGFGPDTGGGGGNPQSPSWSPATGNTIIVAVTGEKPTAISDPTSGANVYTEITAGSASTNDGGEAWYVYRCFNATGWTNGKITATVSGAYSEMYVCEIAGLGANPTVDVAVYLQNVGNIPNPVVSPSFSTAQANEILIAYGINTVNQPSSALQIGGNAATAVTDSQTGSPGIAGYYIASAVLTSKTSQFTCTGGSYNYYSIGTVSLKPATGGGGSATAGDTIAISSSATASGTHAGSATAADTLTLSSAAAATASGSRTTSDSLSIDSAATSGGNSWLASAGDTLSLSSTASGSGTHGASATAADSLSLSSTAIGTRTGTRTASDSLALSSAATAHGTHARTATDSLAISSSAVGSGSSQPDSALLTAGFFAAL